MKPITKEIHRNKYWQDFFNKNLYKEDFLCRFWFLSIHTREKIEDIIKRISLNKEITFQEKIFVENHAKNSSSILPWFKREISQRSHGERSQESISGIDY